LTRGASWLVPRCAECGYDYDELARDEITGALAALAPRYGAVLTEQASEALRAHPRPESWSVLEYGCHFRDVCRVQVGRIARTQVEEDPTFTSMRRNERAVEDAYNEQDPATVRRELKTAVSALVDQLESLPEAGWSRRGLYLWPATELRSVEWIGRHTVHEGRHHLFDIDRLLAAPRP
jgi:hypothetical protein